MTRTLLLAVIFQFILLPTLNHPTTSVKGNIIITSPSKQPSSKIVITYCPRFSPHLVGHKPISQVITRKWASRRLLEPGGRYKPPGCIANHRVAIIVPYRNREEHLRTFLQHMHPFLQRQQIEYGIFVIEQSGTGPFNRATLMNIGVVEALNKTYPPFQCFIFHDVDLLPEDDYNTYSCLSQPRAMAVAVDTLNYSPFATSFGGVSAMTKDQFYKVNGFSNSFWGWGGEDDDMYNRIQYHNMSIYKYSPEVARYTMLSHQQASANPERLDLIKNGSERYSTDGLNSLKYKRLDVQLKPLFTHITVKLTDFLHPQNNEL